MAKKKIIALFVMAALLVTAALPVLVACNDKADVTGKGVERPENIFTDDIDTVDSDNLATGAQITASSAAETAANVLDGNTETAWTAENTSGQFLEITFSEPVSFNTVVLRENGNYITGFRFEVPDGDGWREIYRQDRMERYRYCTFDAVETDSIRIVIDGVNEGREISVAEVEVYNVAPKTYAEEFRVFAYYNVNDFKSPALDETELGKQLGVITDLILFEYVYWDKDGNLTFTQEDKNAEDYDPTSTAYLESVIAFVKKLNPEVRICLDILPGNKAEHGLPGCTENLVANIAELVRDLDIDGVEFDWEYPTNIAEWVAYGDMMLALKAEIGGEGRYVSVALSNFNVGFTAEQIAGIDYVQIMGYDRFDPDGNNSSFRSGAYSSMRYFVNIGFKPSQLVLGLPAYGRPDGWQTIWTNYDYSSQWSEENDDTRVSATQDFSTPYTYWDNIQWLHYTGTDLDGGTYDNALLKSWVNGAALVADKTAYVIEQGFAGVMLWRESTDYAWDAVDGNGMPLSALRSIYDTACDRIVGYGENA